MIPDSLAPGIVIRAPDKTSARESGDEAILRNLTASAKPRERSFTDLREALFNHYNPKPSVMIQRLRFDSRVRHMGVSVAEFVSALRALSDTERYAPRSFSLWY